MWPQVGLLISSDLCFATSGYVATGRPHHVCELQFLHLGLEKGSYVLYPEVPGALYFAVLIWVRSIALQGTEQGIISKRFQEALWRTDSIEP